MEYLGGKDIATIEVTNLLLTCCLSYFELVINQSQQAAAHPPLAILIQGCIMHVSGLIFVLHNIETTKERLAVGFPSSHTQDRPSP
jgi:hypothetical protein